MIKSSTLRCSLGSIQSSGLNLPSLSGPRGTKQPIWQERSSTGNSSMRRAPLLPAISRDQLASTPQASGVTSPRPVMTTRRNMWDPELSSGFGRGCRKLLRALLRAWAAAPDLQRQAALACFSKNFTASPTVWICSAASSGISQPNSSSKAITSSTVSRLSAPRSSMKLALSVTLSASTPRCSTTIFFTRAATSLIALSLGSLLIHAVAVCQKPVGVKPTPETAPWLEQIRGPTADFFLGSTPKSAGSLTHFIGLDQHSSDASQASIVAGKMASYHDHTAVHMQGLTGDIAGLGGRQVDRGRGHVVRCTERLRRDRFLNDGRLLFAQRLGHRRGDKARRDAIDGNAAGGDLAGQRFRHADHARLGGGIVALAGIADDAADRGDINDAAITGLGAHHGARRRPHQHEARGQIDGNDLVPLFVLHHHEQVVFGEAGIVNQNLEPTELGQRRIDELGDLCLVGQIARA